MKRTVSVVLSVVFVVVALLSITAYAETYHLSGTDMSISVDDAVWYVFTRDNIKNNAELEELGVTYDEMYDILYNNEAYMDAILYYENGEWVEFFVRKRALDTGVANLSNYENSEVIELAKELAKKRGAETYSVYENQYKFASWNTLIPIMGITYVSIILLLIRITIHSHSSQPQSLLTLNMRKWKRS